MCVGKKDKNSRGISIIDKECNEKGKKEKKYIYNEEKKYVSEK